MKYLLIFLSVCLLLSCNLNRQGDTLSAIQNLPPFKIQLIDSASFLNTAQVLGGKPTIILYFRPSCPHCQKETEIFIKNINTLKSVNIYMLANASLEDIKGYSARFDLDQYKNIFVGKDFDHSFIKIFQPSSVPFMALYNSNKSLIKTYYGEVDISTIINSLKS